MPLRCGLGTFTPELGQPGPGSVELGSQRAFQRRSHLPTVTLLWFWPIQEHGALPGERPSAGTAGAGEEGQRQAGRGAGQDGGRHAPSSGRAGAEGGPALDWETGALPLCPWAGDKGSSVCGWWQGGCRGGRERVNRFSLWLLLEGKATDLLLPHVPHPAWPQQSTEWGHRRREALT